ncbi:MAG: META domain-containing protein, partial [Chloroflexota bacterium]|nr:META domain-containing protein [Chloroflexota bacterium]
VNDIGMTEMFCVDPENIMQQEIDYLNALASATIYQVSDERLIFTDTNGEELLIYSRFEPLGLTGTEWELVFYNDGEGAFVSVLNGTQITALFEEAGKLSGTAGCNEYSTAYQVDGNTITIDSAAITMMYCAEPEGIMEQESAYLAAVESAETFQIERNNLTMENASGVRVLSYMAEKMEIGDKTVPDVEATVTSEVIAPTTSPGPEETTTPVPTNTPQPTATPKPTSTPEQTYTLTPAASATPTPLPNLVFEDDFKYDTGWIEYKTETHSFIRKDDTYYISVNTANGYIWSIRSLNPPDVILETDAAMVEGSDQAYYGVVCRFEKGANYYFMVVNDSGAYAIGMVKGGGKPEMLVQGSNQGGIVLSGNQLNHLRGDCIGDTLTLYVNGEKLLETQDDSFSEGEVGLIVLSSYKNYQVQVKFDYFAVYEPD